VPAVAAIGADPTGLEDTAAALRAASSVLAARARYAATADRTGWSGPDAARLGRDLRAVDRALVDAADGLGRAAARLRNAAAEQRRASRATPAVAVVASSRTDGGRLVQRVGPADAPVAVVLVPGVGTDPGDRVRLRRDAERVWRAVAGVVDHPEGVAVVSWLGYDPPDVVVGAVDPRPADEGAAALRAEVAALRAGGARRVVVVGHSYGAVVAGRAVESGADADVLVQLGAPGVGRPGATARIAALGAVHRVAREDDDPIAWVTAAAGPLYGEDPVGRVPQLPTSRHGHGAYLRDPVLLGALAGLAAGRGQPVPSPPWASPWTSRTASPRS
jgi:hypothetical protein